jgi:V-type H+-transporting ATPase subunit C
MYWLVSLPLDGASPDIIWSRLQEHTTYTNDYSSNFKFKLPDTFRVGTLDSLLVLSDDLVKISSTVEMTVSKVRRQLNELQASFDDKTDVWVEGMMPETYLQRFTWNEAKYPSRRPLKDTIGAIAETIAKIEEDLKAKVTEYGQLKSAMAAYTRKHTGSLAVRDLAGLLPPSMTVDTEHMTTLLAVVPRATTADWLTKYEMLSDFVVPRSSAIVAEDSDYVVFNVVLFRRVVDSFKTSARAAGFQIKDAGLPGDFAESGNGTTSGSGQNKPSGGNSNSSNNIGGGGSSAAASKKDAIEQLQAKMAEKGNALEEWCLTSYGEVFSGWIHLTAVRLFAESILRYGLPPQFAPVLMKPNGKQVSKLRKLLAHHFGGVGGEHFSEGGGGGGGGGGEDMYPYVSFSLNIDEHHNHV